jgi:hypothetical protein
MKSMFILLHNKSQYYREPFLNLSLKIVSRCAIILMGIHFMNKYTFRTSQTRLKLTFKTKKQYNKLTL